MWFMDNESHEPQSPIAATSTWTLADTGTRHDGWSGDKMAKFCEVLAETAVVAEACDQAGMGISGAYALRRRNPFFAAAWDASLTIARERLADTLLARSMEGNVEQIYRDGELIGERHVLDNRLGLAILRRLDRLAETGSPLHSNSPQFPGAGHSRQSTILMGPDGRGPGAQRSVPAILSKSQSFDWEMMVDALRTGDPDAVAQALALLEGHKVEEVEDPPNRPPSGDLRDGDEFLDLSDRCWKDEDDIWMTDFPPPPDFTGWESGPWGESDFERECTAEEIAILEADQAADAAAVRAEEEALRDEWFSALRAELAEPPSAGEELRSDCDPASKRWREPASGSPPGEPD
jgi:hypothetical protein